MSQSTTPVYVVDDLIHNGSSHARGAKLTLDSEVADRLIESGQVSKSKPKEPTAADIDGGGTPDAIDFAEFVAGLRDNVGAADDDELVEVHENLAEAVEVLRQELVDRELVEEPEQDEPGAVTLPAIEYSELSKTTLEELSAARELEVERTDGKKGDLRAEDYAAALTAADEAIASGESDSDSD